MEVVLKSDLIYQQIFINWWIEQKYLKVINEQKFFLAKIKHGL